MARERISLVPEEVQKESLYRFQIESGEMTPAVFQALATEEQNLVNNILFQIASEKVNPAVALSVLEFTLFSFLRIAMKKLDGIPLTADEQQIETELRGVMGEHEITNEAVPKADWLFEYLQYAQYNAGVILQNRKDHIIRKIKTIGTV